VQYFFKNIWVLSFFISILHPPILFGQTNSIKYGDNPAAGHYLPVADARIYYEVYGSGGTPLVLLHGGLYGYIDEFSALIQEMSRNRQVIAVATRGHGKSDIGKQPFTYQLLASDAFAVIKNATNGKVDVLGFSDGAITSYVIAAEHPELVRKLVAVGGPRGQRDWTPKAVTEFKETKPSDIERIDPAFVAERKKLMPEPARWLEFATRVTDLEDQREDVSDDEIRSIQAPTLIIAGDRDPYNQTENFVGIYRLLPKAQLMLVPGCGHLVFVNQSKLTIDAVSNFLADH
jgi:pimeloyl-ACP methyl ester carboxylesterase